MYLRDPLGWTPNCCGLYLEPSRDLFSALQRTNSKVHIGPLVLPMGSFPTRTKNCLGDLLKPNIFGASFRSSWASESPQYGKGYQGSCFKKNHFCALYRNLSTRRPIGLLSNNCAENKTWLNALISANIEKSFY